MEASMASRGLLVLAMLLMVSANETRAANGEADFKAAMAAAEAAERESGALKNQWTTTEDTLAAARKAAAEGDFDTAVADAQKAEALAKASIAQGREQETAWRSGVIR
jgi:hypothetical protein